MVGEEEGHGEYGKRVEGVHAGNSGDKCYVFCKNLVLYTRLLSARVNAFY